MLNLARDWLGSKFREGLDGSVRMHFTFPLLRVNVLMESLVCQDINVDVYAV